MSAEDGPVESALDRGEQCDGTHPRMLPDGSIVHLYDLVAHCQSWATDPRQGTAVSGYPVPPEDLAEKVAAGLAFLVGVLYDDLMEKSRRPSPFRDRLRNAGDPQRAAGCYEASFGWVHVKPGCTCPR